MMQKFLIFSIRVALWECKINDKSPHIKILLTDFLLNNIFIGLKPQLKIIKRPKSLLFYHDICQDNRLNGMKLEKNEVILQTKKKKPADIFSA